MKEITLVKYQLKDMKYVFLILYAILILITILNGTTLVIDGVSSSNSGMDVSSSITFMIVAICCFSETFGMWIQNGVSRKNIFKGFLGGTLAISVICSVADCIIALILPLVLKTKGYYSVLSYVFEDYLDQCGGLVVFLIEIIFTTLICAAGMMVGYFIAILFYRAGKFMRIAIPSGIPIFFFGVLPTLGAYFYESVVVQKVINFFYTILGIKSGNPFYLIVTVIIAFVLLSALNYLLIRKTQVRTQS